jgi:hypothetical protein
VTSAELKKIREIYYMFNRDTGIPRTVMELFSNGNLLDFIDDIIFHITPLVYKDKRI